MANEKFSDFQVATGIDGTETLAGLQAGSNTLLPVGLISPSQLFIAYINQSGSSSPVATILKNTLPGVPVFARVSAGTYTMTLAGAFPAGKVFIPNGVDRPIINFSDTHIKTNQVYRSSDDQIVILVWWGVIGTMALTDSMLSDFDITIMVFP